MNPLKGVPYPMRLVLLFSLFPTILTVVYPLELSMTAEKKCPISPYEVIRRIPDIPRILEWSMKKHLTVSGPEFWGIQPG